MNVSRTLGWVGRAYLLVLLGLAVLAAAWAVDRYVIGVEEGSITLALAAAVGVFLLLGWAFRRAAW